MALAHRLAGVLGSIREEVAFKAVAGGGDLSGAPMVIVEEVAAAACDSEIEGGGSGWWQSRLDTWCSVGLWGDE